MHELSVALALIDIASEQAMRLGDVRVTAVHVRAGALAGIDADALRFSFDVACHGTALEGAILAITTPPLIVWCDACQAERTVVSISCRRCSQCNAIAPRVVSGEEIELSGLEIME